MATPDTFTAYSSSATRIWLCLFDKRGERETGRVPMERDDEGWWTVTVPGAAPGLRYGFRADGPYDPAAGLWFDPEKLLMDPYAVEIDRPYVHDPRLAARRGEGGATAPLMPKAVVVDLPEVARQPARFSPGGLIYEVNVRAFTRLHPDVPEAQRGTLAALAHPAVIEHMTKLGVSTVELMPVTAWIDERHLPALGLANAWGYNPVSFMALDPRLAPGGVAELRTAVAALHEAGIGVVLDLVFNHTGESDALGPTLCLRGLDNRAYYRHERDRPGVLVNDTGCGNTLACDRPVVRTMILDTLRHFVRHAGVDGFRFDLGPVLGRGGAGFDPNAAIFDEIAADPLLSDRVMIAEPWDIGPGGYQLGNFPASWLEWNDRWRDDVRRFWRGDAGMVGALATRLSGSSDVFRRTRSRSVNFVAAHDGMTLADLTAYRDKHNQANGEDNRDGHDENFSWNHGVEGASDDADIVAARRGDAVAMLATLFVSRGTPMLTAGDEFGRTQHGNNNAYAQDNDVTWLDWAGRDRAIEAAAFALGRVRRDKAVLREQALLTGETQGILPDVAWLREDGEAMRDADWNEPERRSLAMVLAAGVGGRLAAVFDAGGEAIDWRLPRREGWQWVVLFDHDVVLSGNEEVPPLRPAARDTSPPVREGRGWTAARRGACPLPPTGGEVASEARRRGGLVVDSERFRIEPRSVTILEEREVQPQRGETQ